MIKIKSPTSIFFLGLFLVNIPILLLSNRIAEAAPQATWVNASTISYNGNTYKEDNATDNDWHFYEVKPDDGCKDEIKGFDYSPRYGGAFKKQEVQIHKQKDTPGGCETGQTENITLLAQPDGYRTPFIWIDSGLISSTDGKKTYKYDKKSNTFISESDKSGCKDFISSTTNGNNLNLVIRSNEGGGIQDAEESLKDKYGGDSSGWYFINDIKSAGDRTINGDPCHQSKPILGIRADNTNVGLAPGTGKRIDGGGSSSASGDAVDGCEASGNSLAWIICPVVNLFADATSALFEKVILPLLETDPVQAKPGDGLYEIWKSVRNIANALIVLFLLIAVYAQATGGGLVDAYTARKILPRVLAAAILINLSIYIVGFLVDVTNVLGAGIENLIKAPFPPGELGLQPGNIASIIGAGALYGAIVGILVIPGAFGAFALMVLVPLLIAAVGVFVTLFIRQGLIVFLVISAPVAFALFCLPATEKYGRQWWSLLTKTLLVYPIVITIMSIASIFPTLLEQSDNQTNPMADLIGLVALMIPLFLIPFAFKIAGGITGSVSGAITGASAGLKARSRKAGGQRAAVASERLGRKTLAKRAEWQSSLQDKASSRRGLGRFATNRMAGMMGYNVQAAASARQAMVSKEIGDQIATGRDDEIRGLSVNKKAATIENGLMRIGAKGQREYQTLGGAWVNEAQVDAGHKRWGNDVYAQQAALSYEMRKAMTDDQVAGLGARYQTLATGDGGWGMTTTQAGGALKGAGFENQNQHLEFKYMKTDGTVDGAAMAEEMYEKRGSYQLSQMSGHTIDQLQEAYDEAGRTGDYGTQRKIEGVAETFMSRYGSGGGREVPGEAGATEYIPDATGAGATAGGRAAYQTNSQGGAAVAQKVRKLAVNVGIYREQSPGTNTQSVGPSPPNDRQG